MTSSEAFRAAGRRQRALLQQFAGRRVLVVGDVVLDEYLIGRATRLSREAPVPVLELVERYWRPGAAANPAANIAALDGEPVMVGVIGADQAGERLSALLMRARVDTAGLVEAADRSTAIKTRILATHASAHAQQVARLDDLPPPHLSSATEGLLLARFHELLPSCEAILVSNYRGGVVTPRLLGEVIRGAARHGIPTCVDSQGDLLTFRGFTLVKSNQPDAEAALGLPLHSEDAFSEAGTRLVQELGAEYAVITRGADGMSVVAADGGHTHLPPTNRTEVWDVTGAGDTVIAVLALGLASKANMLDTAAIANAAAGLVVRRIGVATVTPEELAGAGESWP